MEKKNEVECPGKKRKRKIVFDNLLKDEVFLNRIDFTNSKIKQSNEQPSDLISNEMFTIFKSQLHIDKNFLIDHLPVHQHFFDALMNYTHKHLIKEEPSENLKSNSKRLKHVESNHLQYIETLSYTNYEPIPISLELSKIEETGVEQFTDYRVLKFNFKQIQC